MSSDRRGKLGPKGSRTGYNRESDRLSDIPDGGDTDIRAIGLCKWKPHGD